ncbi:MAG: hypothetical protein KAY32_11615 [Candidatus Eisenbacteria sp.]|nr:hypothetical protein [Candidatus Eisenbacteria bacterium]
MPLDSTFLLTINDDWGRRKRERFRSLGLRTEVLWERAPAEKGIEGSEVRRRMAAGEPWRHLVPLAVGALLESWGFPPACRGTPSAEVNPRWRRTGGCPGGGVG